MDRPADERCHRPLGDSLLEPGEAEVPADEYARSLALARSVDDPAGLLARLGRLAALAEQQDDRAELIRLQAEHEKLVDELGELAYVGPSATPRHSLIDAAVAAVASPLPPIEDHLDRRDLGQVADAVLRHAVQLRKDGRFEQALTFYAGVIARSVRLDAPARTATALRGAGLCYLKLARAALVEDGSSGLLQPGGSTSLGTIIAEWHRAFLRRALGLAERSRACHRGALELQKATGTIGGQASELANLAPTEQLLGNHETARRYLIWALRTHRAVSDWKAAEIDVTMLAALEREIGDEEAAAAWEGKNGALRE